jgi:16S rRNA (uracil1498-N3)-methyltransferase
MHSFYIPELIDSDTHQQLSEEESLHACKVLRLQSGVKIRVFNGKGLSAIAEISFIHPKNTTIDICEKPVYEALPYELHIAIAPTKMNERMEWFVEKATEIGATEITFINCHNSERKQINIERFRRIALSAVKQSQRLHLPSINDLTSFHSFCELHKDGFIAHCYNQEKIAVTQFETLKKATILIGPEGDFSKEEVDLALKYGYKGLSLGSNRLRTETAGLVAVTQFMQLISN